MTFQFCAAVRQKTPMVVAIAGASGSGKTFSALELATGLAGAGKIAMIDSEGRRALHYADLFKFDHAEWRPPFEPKHLLDALQTAESAGYRVIVVDSGSDEHEGEGGLVDMAAAGKNTNSAANWARPKAEHKRVIRWLRQTRCHVIFCFRAEEKVRIEKIFNESKQREETVIVPLGWQPIAEKRFMYDMTASFLMTPDAPGIPRPIKLQEQHRAFFPLDAPITKAAGEELAEWADGGIVPVVTVGDAEDHADKGIDAFRDWWKVLSKSNRDLLRDHLGSLQERADKADQASQDPPQPEPEPDAEPDDGLRPTFVVDRVMAGRSLNAKATADALVARVESHVRTQAHCNEFHRVNRDVMSQLKIANPEEHFRVLEAIARDRE